MQNIFLTSEVHFFTLWRSCWWLLKFYFQFYLKFYQCTAWCYRMRVKRHFFLKFFIIWVQTITLFTFCHKDLRVTLGVLFLSIRSNSSYSPVVKTLRRTFKPLAIFFSSILWDFLLHTKQESIRNWNLTLIFKVEKKSDPSSILVKNLDRFFMITSQFLIMKKTS